MKEPQTVRCNLSKRSYGSSPGFTLLETLVTLVLVSLLVLVLSTGVIGSQRLTADATGAAASTTRLLQLDRYLRKTVGRIVIPYWVGPVSLDALAGPLQLPYLDGERELILVLETRERGLVVRTPEDPEGRWFGPFAAVTAETVVTDGRLAGVRVLVDIGQGPRTTTIEAAIGSNPMREGS